MGGMAKGAGMLAPAMATMLCVITTDASAGADALHEALTQACRVTFDRLDSDECVLEGAPLERLAREGQLMAFEHPGFWQPMDTLREKRLLEELWASGKAPWKVWN